MTTASQIDLVQLDDAQHTCQAIVQRTQSLYSLPAVAMEVIQLTSNPKVDVKALKECIERDPALTAKLLRVVNSSLFGLSREVSDLNQALALLGTKPLKLLVLGFSLPDELFAEVAGEQLEWFWRTSLVRAVAARDLSERFWNKPGDDAFLAGLLQDIGVLVLLGQLRDPYVQFLARVIETGDALGPVEVQSMGFDHTTLSAALLRDWKLPEQMVAAVSAERSIEELSRKETNSAELGKQLHLANLLAELVGQNRLQVLPELLAAGEAYCGLDKSRLNEILPDLQHKVAELADVLSIDLGIETSYSQIVAQAHQEMAQLCESVSEILSRRENLETSESALPEAAELRSAVEGLVNSPLPSVLRSNETSLQQQSANVVSARKDTRETATFLPASPVRDRTKALTLAVGTCRSKRCPLSVMLVNCHSRCENQSLTDKLTDLVDSACRALHCDQLQVEQIGPNRWFLILKDCERQEAVRHARELFRDVPASLQQLGTQQESVLYSLSVGVASVAMPSRNFHPPDLLASAQRCLSAAELSDADVVKSIEIF